MYNGMEMMDMMNEKELENITGGKAPKISSKKFGVKKPNTTANVALATMGTASVGTTSKCIPFACVHCGYVFNADISKASEECPNCHQSNEFAG
ncbi:MAG: hypothetical protein K6E91_02380 [Butyrivibrio sp.]|nr:hypothetical protein [Butyrivibrio sp.]